MAWTRRGGARRYALAAALLALGLLAKPMLVTLPFTLLLLDVWPLDRAGRGARALVWEKLPLFALSALACAVTLAVRREGGALAPEETVSFGASLANAVTAYAVYLGKTLVPVGLVAHVPHPFLPRLGGTPLAAWQVASAAGLLLAIGAAVFASRRRPLQVGWLWYLGTLVPVIGLVQVRTSGLADRYTYVPLVGVFVMVVWGGAEIERRWRESRPATAAALRAVAVAALVACGIGSFLQLRHWRDTGAFYEHALAVTPRNVRLLYNYASYLDLRGDSDAAVAHYRRALEVDPASYDVNVNLGVVLQGRGELAEARARLEAAVAARPGDAAAHYNLANTLFEQGEMRAAIDHYARAAASDPGLAEAHYGAGNAHVALGEERDAVRSYRRALELRPDFPEARYNLERVLAGDRRGLFRR